MTADDYPDLDLERIDELVAMDGGGLFATFVERYPESVARFDLLEQALAARDAAAAREHAHKLAGRSLNIGASAAGEQARAIEIAIEDGDLDVAAAALPELKATLARTVEQLAEVQG